MKCSYNVHITNNFFLNIKKNDIITSFLNIITDKTFLGKNLFEHLENIYKMTYSINNQKCKHFENFENIQKIIIHNKNTKCCVTGIIQSDKQQS